MNEEANTEFKPRRLRLEVKAKIEMFLPSLDGLDGTVAGSDWLCSSRRENMRQKEEIFPPAISSGTFDRFAAKSYSRS